MRHALTLLVVLLAGCADIDRIADTKEVTLLTIKRTCEVRVPRDWLNDRKISAFLAEHLPDCAIK